MSAVRKHQKLLEALIRPYFERLSELDARIKDKNSSPAARKVAREERARFVAGPSLERHEHEALAKAEADAIRRSRKTSQDWLADAQQHEDNAKRFAAAGDDVRAKRAKTAAVKSRAQAIRFEKAGK